MGYQRSNFPLSVYGCIDAVSRKVIWLRIWTDNCNPKRIVRWYFDYLFEKIIVTARLRTDKSSETGDMATMHAILRNGHGDLEDPFESVIFGKSTANQIERWWRELHDRFEKYFKEQLMHLLEQGHYDPQNDTHRSIIYSICSHSCFREKCIYLSQTGTTIASDSRKILFYWMQY